MSSRYRHWFVRKNGWVQGPFITDTIQHMYAIGWVSAADSVSIGKDGPWRAAAILLADCKDLDCDEITLAPPEKSWEYASRGLPCDRPVSFAELQMLAADGRLLPSDMVRKRIEDKSVCWQTADHFGGIFGGRRTYCTACGAHLNGQRDACDSCRAPQPDYEDPSNATLSLSCGTIALLLLLLAIPTVVGLAARGDIIVGLSMAEYFPAAFAVVFAPVVFLGIIGCFLGNQTLLAVKTGLVAPGKRWRAHVGKCLGAAALCATFITAVAIIFFCMGHFSRNP